jgi:PhzF family phenazine biosynthesis protein
MAFAGHPTLGSAFVVRLLGCRDPVITLAMPAGVIEVAEQHGRWRLTAPPAQHRETPVTRAALAAALGLGSDDILWHDTGARPLWVNSGSDQFMVPLASAAAVQRAAPNVSRFDALVSSEGRRMAYVFAPKTHTNNSILSRFFFEADGSLREDPATGSACANLGGWLLATGTRAPIGLRVDQGAQIRRPSTLWLELDAERRVHVGGDIAHLGSGEIEI